MKNTADLLRQAAMTALSAVFMAGFSAGGATAAEFEQAAARALAANCVSRVGSIQDVPPGLRGGKSYAYRPVHNLPAGNTYVIVTDHTDPSSLAALARLARYHSGQVLQIKDFRNLYLDTSARSALIDRLARVSPRYVALAPRLENFSENSLLAIWQVLLPLGGGRLNVYPSFLVAGNSDELIALIDRAMQPQSFTADQLHPVVIAQATDAKGGGMRAVQKAKIVEDIFQNMQLDCPGLIIRSQAAPLESAAFAGVGSLGTLNVQDNGRLAGGIPLSAKEAIKSSRMLMLFGHGSPGMTCSLAVNAFRDIAMPGDIVLCGSCFSCTPAASDVMPQRPNPVSALAFRAIANGAQTFWGHMHENEGFPQLYVVFESLMRGESVGQSYQQVMNEIFSNCRQPVSQFVLNSNEISDKQAVKRRNPLLFVMIGDPAATPVRVDGRGQSGAVKAYGSGK